MIFHVSLVREFDGVETLSYRGAFQSETRALANLADALGFYAGARGYIQYVDENDRITKVREVTPDNVENNYNAARMAERER